MEKWRIWRVAHGVELLGGWMAMAMRAEMYHQPGNDKTHDWEL